MNKQEISKLDIKEMIPILNDSIGGDFIYNKKYDCIRNRETLYSEDLKYNFDLILYIRENNFVAIIDLGETYYNFELLEKVNTYNENTPACSKAYLLKNEDDTADCLISSEEKVKSINEVNKYLFLMLYEIFNGPRNKYVKDIYSTIK